jgi:hypothetical protein
LKKAREEYQRTTARQRSVLSDINLSPSKFDSRFLDEIEKELCTQADTLDAEPDEP